MIKSLTVFILKKLEYINYLSAIQLESSSLIKYDSDYHLSLMIS